MAKQWTRRQYYERVETIENKYEPLMLAWRKYAMNMNHEERLNIRFSKLQQRVDGLNTAFQILHAQCKRDAGIAILESQVAEPTVQFLPHFVETVQMVLDDMKTDVVAPLTPLLLQIA